MSNVVGSFVTFAIPDPNAITFAVPELTDTVNRALVEFTLGSRSTIPNCRASYGPTG